MRLWPVGLVVSGCFSAPSRPGDGPDAPVITTGFRRTIRFTQPPANTLENFPVSVVLPDDASLRDKSQGVSHVAFTSTDGAVLPCEIVQLSETGTLEAWVRVPTLPTTPSEIELAYGPDVTSPCDPSAVWDEYRGAWHLSESAPGSARDSSSYKHTLLGHSAGLPTPMEAAVGTGLHFAPGDADGADELCVDSTPALELGTEPFSYELWVDQEQYLGMYDIALHKGARNNGSPGFDVELGLEEWNAYVRDAADPENRLTFAPDSTTLVNKWHHLAVTVDREAGFMRAYRDGIQTEIDAIVVDSVSGAAPLCLGAMGQPMLGWLDEVRVHGQARSPEWFVTSYANVALRADFMTIGPER